MVALLPSRLATRIPRLLTGVQVSKGSIKDLAARQLSSSIRFCSSKTGKQKTGEERQSTEASPAIAETKSAEVEASDAPSFADMSRDMSYRPDNLDKRILVHYKYYPNVESVPEYVSQGQMNKESLGLGLRWPML